MHNKGTTKVSDSVLFLKNYWETLNSNTPSESDVKGKKPLYDIRIQLTTAEKKAKEHWSRPQGNCVKLNVDASFVPALGSAWVGAVARDSTGSVLFSIGRLLHMCTNAEEAEASALLLGLKCLRDINKFQVQVESDCAAAVAAVNTEERNKSKWWATYEEAKTIMNEKLEESAMCPHMR